MIELKPHFQHQSDCPYCGDILKSGNILWQGMHICVESSCSKCDAKIIEDLRVGHTVTNPYKIDLEKGNIFGDEARKEWLGQPLLTSLQNPHCVTVEITKEVFKKSDKAIILNCIDYLYGHCLLKLLNAQNHLEHQADYGLIVVVQKFLLWMVPEGVAEIWIVDIPLRKGGCYYPNFNQFVHEELKRFKEVFISKAHSHPSQFDITKFTKVGKHSFAQEEFRVTFVWREDRIWCNSLLWGILRRLKLIELVLLLQNWRLQRLFKTMRVQIPMARFTVAGLGKRTRFPNWIEDLRVEKFSEKTEITVCKVYSESRLVIGVHGSNMLLPSGHAGMTIDLMPKERWRNFAQDILYQESDSRLASFRYRYLPLQTSAARLAHIALTMLQKHSEFDLAMIADKWL